MVPLVGVAPTGLIIGKLSTKRTTPPTVARFFRAITGGDEVKVIGHEGVRGNADAAFLAMRFKEAEEVFAIGVA